MGYLKKIIKEEIEKILFEEVFYDEPSSDVFETQPVSKDDIIYNYELGRKFGNNNLQIDINNLNSYDLTEYLPKSVNQEKWSFDFETAIGSMLIIDIVRNIRGGKSFWTMMFGIMDRNTNIPSLKELVEDVEGYDNFIQVINKGMANNIDVSKY